MPSEETLLQQAENWKKEGNAAFQKGELGDAVSAYSQGIVACDRITPPPAAIKAALLSNRAMCSLKTLQYTSCIEDCTTAMDLHPADAKLRSKILYRRSKARFMMANLNEMKCSASGVSNANTSDLLQEAAKDLLTLLQTDPKNSEASQLLMTIRAQVKSQQTASTPVSRTLQALREADTGDTDTLLHQVKILLGLVENDTVSASMELGRLNGIPFLISLAKDHPVGKVPGLAIQCLSQAGNHPAFVRAYLVKYQKDLCDIVRENASDLANRETNVIVLALAAYVRILLHADRDDPEKDIDGKTELDYPTLVEACKAALSCNENTVIRAVLDLVTTWTCGKDREATIRAALGGTHQDPALPAPRTQQEIRSLTPQQFSAYRQREHKKTTRDEAWAFERSIFFDKEGGIKALLKAAVACHDHILRREITVVLGRLMVAIEDEDKIKKVAQTYLGEPKRKDEGVVIEEVFNEDEDEKNAEEEEIVSLETKMERALITSALLLSRKEIGAWALGTGWRDSADEIPDLINSEDCRAMCLASEVVSAAATVESTRHLVGNLLSSGVMQKLMRNKDRDIRSGAASAVAKLGLSDKGADEGEVIGMLQAACELLEDAGDKETTTKDESSSKFRQFSSFATSSEERAIEMLTYLVSKTDVKEELAAGYQASPDSRYTVMERLVKISDLPNAGESLSGFGLATIFQHMAVTNYQIRKEGFEGKDVSMEQYDELQKMGKTEEEKELMETEKDPDTQASCDERIRKMASANVPRALVALMEGASEHTLEQIAMAMCRMAGEVSVRGIMIQQGVLTACIKVEKKEGPTETDTMKKVIILARHCIAKLLITTNPSLLTSAQRLGSIKPLIHLIRDHKVSDLQQFEALLAITNIASSGDDAKNRIVSERGIPCLHFAMFSDHEMVRRGGTEAMCNLVPHKAMMEHLADESNLKLWLVFAADYEENYECARAATGCLAMATQDEGIAIAMVTLEKFRESINSLLQSGRLEIMHRTLALVLNLVSHGGRCREKVISEGFVAFCEAYVNSFHDGNNDLDFPEEEAVLLPVTVDVAKKIISIADSKDT